MQKAPYSCPVQNSCLKWSHYAKIGSYLMIFFIFKKVFLYQPDFGRFLVKMGGLGHSEVKKCAKGLIFLPSPKIQSQIEPLCKNWILSNDFFHFLKNISVPTWFWLVSGKKGYSRPFWGHKVCKRHHSFTQSQIQVSNGATTQKLVSLWEILFFS